MISVHHTHVSRVVCNSDVEGEDGMRARGNGVEVGGADGALLVRASAKKEMGMRMYSPCSTESDSREDSFKVLESVYGKYG